MFFSLFVYSAVLVLRAFLFLAALYFRVFARLLCFILSFFVRFCPVFIFAFFVLVRAISLTLLYSLFWVVFPGWKI